MNYMVDLTFSLRKTAYHANSNVSLFIKQQKLIRIMTNFFKNDIESERVLDKLIDCTDMDLHRIYEIYINQGLEKSAEEVRKLKRVKFR